MDTRAVSTIGAVERRSVASTVFRLPIIAAVVIVAWPCPPIKAQTPLQRVQTQTNQTAQREDAGAEAELQAGIALTRQGHFRDAIPHFLAAQGHVSNEFVLDFDLALCYVATDQFKQAIPILSALRGGGHVTADVYNLLAQAYIGNAQPEEAFNAFQQAAALDPQSQKLYLFVADACLDHEYYTLGLDIVNLGLHHLPRSSRLYYERGVLHAFMDQPDLARNDLDQARKLAPGSAISYLAAAQKGMLDGNTPEAIQAAREGVQEDPKDYILLTILGQALIRSGAIPGQPEFAEAQRALERAVTGRPNLAASQLALGQLYRMAGRLDDAIMHLEIARQLAPSNTSVYSHLAVAYQRRGKLQEAQKMLAILASLNQEQAAKYKSGPPDQRPSYTGSPVK
jgi:tetratricopeptide (TPR) repeat protein